MASNQLALNEAACNASNIVTTNVNCKHCGSVNSIRLQQISLKCNNLLNVKIFLENCTIKDCEEIIKKSYDAKCVKEEKLNKIKLLFEKEANIGNLDLLKEFMKLTGDLNFKDSCGNGFLHRASKIGNIQMINFLIEQVNGIDIDIKDKTNNTPLHVATINGHADVVQILLNQNANVNITNDDGKIPLMYINHGDVLQEFIKAKPNFINERYKSNLLFKSIQNNRKELFHKLVDEKINLNIKSDDKVLDNPVIFAARHGRTDMLQKLIQNGADILYQNTNNNTAIHVAANNGHDDCVNILLKNKVNIEGKGYINNTPLLSAAMSGRNSTIEILLDQGANIFSVNKFLWNALHLSSYNGHASTVELLLERGANMNELNDCEKTPLKLATMKGHTEIIQMLTNKGAKMD